MPEAGKDPLGDPEGNDTGGLLEDTPEPARRKSAGDWTAHPPQTEEGEGQPTVPPNHRIWAAILKRLGGSSPGSEENLRLAEVFSRVQFPADQEEVLAKLAPGAEFHLREGIVVDLRQAIGHSRARNYRSIGDLVDCVKDEVRRMEADGLKVLKMA